MKPYDKDKLDSFSLNIIKDLADGLSIDELLKRTYDEFHFSILLTDSTYHYISYAGSSKITDPMWKKIIDDGEPTDEVIINEYIHNKTTDSILSANTPVYIDWGVCADYPQTCSPIFINNNLEAFVSILVSDQKYKDFIFDMSNFLKNFCAIVMQSNKFQLKYSFNPIKEVIASKIFDTKTYTKTLFLKEYIDTFQIYGKFQVVFMSIDPSDNTTNAYLKKVIQKTFPNCLLTSDNQIISILFFNLTTSIDGYFYNLIKKYNFYCGISDVFETLENRIIYIQQAEIAYNLSNDSGNINSIAYFRDAFPDAFLYSAFKTVYHENITPKFLETLFFYDEKHSTDFVTTLRTYLFSRNDINKTAKKLHIHRNTLIYRLNKITDLLNIDIDDADISFKLQLLLYITDLGVGKNR